MKEVFLKTVNVSISAGWMILAVLMLRFLLKKSPKWIRVLLWGDCCHKTPLSVFH